MLPFFMYFVAGAVTGFHVYSLLMLTVLGAPSHPLEFVSLLGSFGLVVAAYLSLFKPHAAARLALVASLAIWLFYGPATVGAVETRLRSHRSELFLGNTISNSVAWSRTLATGTVKTANPESLIDGDLSSIRKRRF
jgi:hypothetical protein